MGRVKFRAKPKRFQERNLLKRLPHRRTGRLTACLWLALAAALVAGCSLEPPGAAEERSRAATAGLPYTQPFNERVLAELPDQPAWRDVLRRAFLANGDLEAAYFEWLAAVRRIERAANWPNTNVMVNFDYMFSPASMKFWDRTTIGVGFDPSLSLMLPQKIAQDAKVAYDEARAKGERFRAAKFALQEKVLTAWYGCALAAEKVRIQAEVVELQKMLAGTAASRVASGGRQAEMLRAQTEVALAENELATIKADLATMRAMLNGMLARPAEAALEPPGHLPAPRPIPADDATLIAVGVEQNPELAALAQETAGRSDALERARLEYLPDFIPQVSITGSIQQAIGLAVMLPTTTGKIRGMIEESRAMVRATEAMARQARGDRGGRFVAALAALRDHERRATVFETEVLPRAREVVESMDRAFSAGKAEFAAVVEARRMLLEIRLLVSEARMAREKRLVELETLAGTDVETLGAEPGRAEAAARPIE